MKVLVLGAGGVVGQHMMHNQPSGLDALYARRTPGYPYIGLDLTNPDHLYELLSHADADVVVNLAGENRVDVVEKNPVAYEDVNVTVPVLVGSWCEGNDRRLIQVSTQGVFSGDHAPYGPDDVPHPKSRYGQQKRAAELGVMEFHHWLIARLTFVLGVRFFPAIGRKNPLEDMIESPSQLQVWDRWFSPIFAHDAALQLWKLIGSDLDRKIVHLGIPGGWSRASIAARVNDLNGRKNNVTLVREEVLKVTPRPHDTSWKGGSYHSVGINDGIQESIRHWRSRAKMDTRERAREISIFLNENEDEVRERLNKGFHHNHALVAADFNSVKPKDDAALLEWYRLTTAYIYELSAYHLDTGFNYSGMCEGIAQHLKNLGKPRILCLGDGIGDLTMCCLRAGLEPVYNDLFGSMTAEFAQFRFRTHLSEPVNLWLTSDWQPVFPVDTFDAVVALDFLEHVTDVELWTAAIHATLKTGGIFLAQNAFAIGSGEDGSIPMHLSCNDHWEHDWVPLLESLGFEDCHNGWWEKL
jgi:dTDP-4-dehydrorhamnose reductase/SAM-dependent methyltransferase